MMPTACLFKPGADVRGVFLMTEKDREMMAGLYRTYSRLMFQIARLVLADSAGAEDAVSEAFLKIIRHCEKFHEMEAHQIKAYIVSTIRTTAYNMHKQRKPVASDEALFALPDEKTNIEDEVTKAESRATITAVIAQLPDKLRTVAHAFFVQGLSHEDIARMYGISVSASKKRLERAKLRLREGEMSPFFGQDC